MNILSVIAQELRINQTQVETVKKLFDEGATVPFIARYRKEHTGGLDEEQLRLIESRFQYLTLLAERKESVLHSIEEQGQLTDELRERINSAEKMQQVEDLYLPYKPKRQTRGSIAKTKGLEPLALFIIENPEFSGDFDALLSEYINPEKEVTSGEEALQGAKDIIAEMISDSADVRQIVRQFLFENATLVSKKVTRKKEQSDKNKKDVFEIYHNFSCAVKRLKEYQVLALNRGETEKFIKISFEFDKGKILTDISRSFLSYSKSCFGRILIEVVEDSFTRLIYPSIEREIRKSLTEKADLHAIEIFASNLKQLLLQPPINNKIIMGIDPGYVSGCKVAVIDTTGKYLEGITIYPHPPQKKSAQALEQVLQLIKKYQVELIAVGNGTASRETELLVAEMIKENNLACHYLIVSEAGASVYSASPLAKQEFPDLDASQRGNISIARRVLDPLAELVKIEPKAIGVGLYQHDVDQKQLAQKLENVVSSCVNYVGVDINTASASLLTYVSGLSKRIATNLVTYREQKGKFTSRKEILDVAGVGEKLFEQAAGFLKISGGDNPLDNTFIHPESYKVTEKLLQQSGLTLSAIKEKSATIDQYFQKNSLQTVAGQLGTGEPTLRDIIENLKKPGRDPREAMPKPVLRSDVLKMEDLQEGMQLKGTVRNVVDFGAFVDIGVKQDGMVHISQMADKFIKHPIEVVQVGDVVDVTVVSIDLEKGRIALSMRDS